MMRTVLAASLAVVVLVTPTLGTSSKPDSVPEDCTDLADKHSVQEEEEGVEDITVSLLQQKQRGAQWVMKEHSTQSMPDDRVCTFFNGTSNTTEKYVLHAASTFLSVIGWPRSGSSLLSAMLDGHPHMAFANEFDTLMLFGQNVSAMMDGPPTPLPNLDHIWSACGNESIGCKSSADREDALVMAACDHPISSDVISFHGDYSREFSDGTCPVDASIHCLVKAKATVYRGSKEDMWSIDGTSQGYVEPPLQVLGGKKVGRPMRRHAVNPDASWAALEQMGNTWDKLKWIYLMRNPYDQISNCLIHEWCSIHDLDYKDNRTEWEAQVPLTFGDEWGDIKIQRCMNDFEWVAIAAADVVPGLGTRNLGPVLSLKYEDLTLDTTVAMNQICSFLEIECSEEYIAALEEFTHDPSENWLKINWGGAVSFQRITDLIERMPPILQLAQYIIDEPDFSMA